MLISIIKTEKQSIDNVKFSLYFQVIGNVVKIDQVLL